MTTIIGVQYKWGFLIAADQQITDSNRPFISDSVHKITEVDEYVIAGAGNSRYCDVIQYGWKPPRYDGSDIYTFMVSKFIPEMHKMHESCGYALKDDETFQFIVGLNKELFYICEDYSVIKTSTGLYGLGTGRDYAIGALCAGATPDDAMEIAKKLDINSGGETQIVLRRA